MDWTDFEVIWKEGKMNRIEKLALFVGYMEQVIG